MNDTKVWLEDEKGNKFAIIKTEKIDMQKELTEQISRLLEENKELKEELQIANDNLKTKQWFNNNQFNLITKYQKVIEILKRLNNEYDYFKLSDDCLDIESRIDLNEEESKLLKEVFGNENS